MKPDQSNEEEQGLLVRSNGCLVIMLPDESAELQEYTVAYRRGIR